MNDNKKRQVSEQVKRCRARFAQSVDAVPGEILPTALLKQWVAEEVANTGSAFIARCAH